MRDYRKAVLQGEIMMLLHDIGKLHWRFVGKATGQLTHKWDLSAAHTLAFLWDVDTTANKKVEKAFKDAADLQKTDALPALQQALLAPTPLLEDQEGSLSCLGALIALHHYNTGGKTIYGHLRTLCSSKEQNSSYDDHPTVYCAMYADTADSQFSKGNETTEETKQTKDTLHLAYPLGGQECAITEKDVKGDANGLAKELAAWVRNEAKPDEKVADWDEDTLVQKRNELRAILATYGKRNLAETRLPNNDVSLWQHSASTAAICKALLASYWIKDSWDGVLQNGNLTHIKQELALLSVRFDDATYLARTVRPFDIVGKRALLHQLCVKLKTLVEDEFCLGNEIYRDSQGICFLVPNLATEKAHPLFDELRTKIAELCNKGLFQGELPWKLQLTPAGLRLTDMLATWNEPYETIISCASGADASLWQKQWHGTSQQICPRCGLRPRPMQASRTGGEDKQDCCKACKGIRSVGAAVIRSLRKGNAVYRDFGKEAFGIDSLADIPVFWEMLKNDDEGNEEETDSKADTRLALVQGIIPLSTLYDSTLFDALLSPLPDGYTWETLEDAVRKAWAEIRKHDLHATEGEKAGTGTIFDCLLKKSKDEIFGTRMCGGAEDGWCCDAEPDHYQRRWIENLVFGGPVQDPSTEEEEITQARAIIRWSLRRHPAPSRIQRVWEETRNFMRSVFVLANEKKLPFVPLTCDAGSFQMLLPSRAALDFMREVAQSYIELFGQVRHILPLHLSAGIFYHKAPLYIAMDAARRFRSLADNGSEEWWRIKDLRKAGDHVVIDWLTESGRQSTWEIKSTLPNGNMDPYHTWFVNQKGHSVPLAALQKGEAYAVRPSTFDFEILDASTRRYDIYYTQKRRPHFMMNMTAGPRPYLLDELTRWKRFASLFTSANASQLKTTLELVTRLHMDWSRERDKGIFTKMLRDILLNCLCEHKGAQITPEQIDALVDVAYDGTLFDLFEWYDFLESPASQEK